MEDKMVCPCGLTCCDCLFYNSEIYGEAQHFKDVLEKYQFDRFLKILSNNAASKAMRKHLELNETEMWNKVGKHFETFKNMPEFMKILESIVDLQCKCTCKEASGCSIAGETHKCSALKCIEEKGYDGCWECAEYKRCDKLSFLKQSYGYVIEENLEIVGKKGTEAVKSRGNRYYSWQRI